MFAVKSGKVSTVGCAFYDVVFGVREDLVEESGKFRRKRVLCVCTSSPALQVFVLCFPGES